MSERTIQNQIIRLKDVAKQLREEGWTVKLAQYFDDTTCIAIGCVECPVGNRHCPRPSIVGLDP